MTCDCASQVFPTKMRGGVEPFELAASSRIRANTQKWASAQRLVARQRKFAFAVVWEVFGQEVKEGRCILDALMLNTHFLYLLYVYLLAL